MSDYDKADENEDFEVYERKKGDDEREEDQDQEPPQPKERRVGRVTPRGRTMMPSPALKDDEESEIYSSRRPEVKETPRPPPEFVDDDSEIYSGTSRGVEERLAPGPLVPADDDDDSEFIGHSDDVSRVVADDPPAPRSHTPRADPPLADVWFGTPPPPRTTTAPEPEGFDLPDPPAQPMTYEVAEIDDGAPTDAPSTHISALPPAPEPIPVPLPRSHPAANHPVPGGHPMRLAIAVTEFNYDITRAMLERAEAHAHFLGCSTPHVVHVPGVYDLPLAVQRLIRRDDVDGVVTIGVVIEGSTDHDDLVIQHAARKLVDLSLEHDKPVGLGITGPGMSRLQAEARIDRAKDAVEACVKLGRTLANL